MARFLLQSTGQLGAVAEALIFQWVAVWRRASTRQRAAGTSRRHGKKCRACPDGACVPSLPMRSRLRLPIIRSVAEERGEPRRLTVNSLDVEGSPGETR